MSSKSKKNKINKPKQAKKAKTSVNYNLDMAKIRKEKHIWAWLIFVPPVGLYKSFKYKALPKFVNISILAIMLTVCVLCFDMLVYPNRVIDSNVKNYIEKTEDLGKVRQMYSTGTVNDKYIIYNVVTTKGIYDVYISDSSGKTISAIQQTAPEQKLIVDNNFEVIDKKANSEILKFFNTEKKFGELEKVIEDFEEGQIVKTSKGQYKFYIKYQQIVQIDEKKNNIYEKVYSKEPVIHIPDNLQKILDKREAKLGKLDKVLSVNINENNIDYVVQMENTNLYKIRFELDGTVVIYNQD